jgi:hypothetical protein
MEEGSVVVAVRLSCNKTSSCWAVWHLVRDNS